MARLTGFALAFLISFSLLAQEDLFLFHAGKKANRFLHYRSQANELIIISGKPEAYEVRVFDEQLNQIQSEKIITKVNSLEDQRLLALRNSDTLKVFLFDKENNKLQTYTLLSKGASQSNGAEHYFGSNMRYIAARIWNDRLHLYFIPTDQNRLLIYTTDNGYRFDFSEYRILIPGFYRRATEDPFTEVRFFDRLFMAEIRSTMHDRLVALSLKVKLFFRGPELTLIADDKDALHQQVINESTQETTAKRHLIRIEGMQPNQSYFYHSLPGPGGCLYRLSRYNRNYWLHEIKGDSVLEPLPMFKEGNMLKDKAHLYTESLENGKERDLNDRNHTLRHIRRLLNDGFCLLRVNEQSNPDSVFLNIGCLRLMESVFQTSGRGNSMQMFEFGYDPWFNYARPNRMGYYLYDHLKVMKIGGKLEILKAESQDSRSRFMDAQEWLKENEAPVHMEWTEIKGVYYILYLDRKGNMRYKVSS